MNLTDILINCIKAVCEYPNVRGGGKILTVPISYTCLLVIFIKFQQQQIFYERSLETALMYDKTPPKRFILAQFHLKNTMSNKPIPVSYIIIKY